jgi:hypothetical protein
MPGLDNLKTGDDPNLVEATEAATAQSVAGSTKEAVLKLLDSWCTDIDAKVEALAKDDQLALIRIQELNSQVTQATQLASNLLAAQDQAASAAIMNIKA